jgi:hypothetical protein
VSKAPDIIRDELRVSVALKGQTDVAPVSSSIVENSSSPEILFKFPSDTSLLLVSSL